MKVRMIAILIQLIFPQFILGQPRFFIDPIVIVVNEYDEPTLLYTINESCNTYDLIISSCGEKFRKRVTGVENIKNISLPLKGVKCFCDREVETVYYELRKENKLYINGKKEVPILCQQKNIPKVGEILITNPNSIKRSI